MVDGPTSKSFELTCNDYRSLSPRASLYYVCISRLLSDSQMIVQQAGSGKEAGGINFSWCAEPTRACAVGRRCPCLCGKLPVLPGKHWIIQSGGTSLAPVDCLMPSWLAFLIHGQSACHQHCGLQIFFRGIFQATWGRGALYALR